MALKPGTNRGPYEILSLIGVGGMGEVYKARDTRLERIVALKVLPAHLAERADLRERFEREARAIANLQHPNICVLHDIGQQDGIHFLVMEYLDGETVALRLMKGPLPLEQVLRYAIEVSDALDRAHRQGYTHRDIKPGNLMLTQDGSKILDFGLAKFKQEAAQPNIPQSQLPTEPSGLTTPGTIVGTVQYMAPEQVEGKTDDVDARADIFAFGAVVYEMAAGQKAFPGHSPTSVMAAILKDAPPAMSTLQPMTPPALERVVKRCLAKDRENRWQTARDLEAQLKWIAEGGSQAGIPAPVVARRKLRERLTWGAAAVCFLLAIALAVPYFGRRPTPPQTVRFPLSPPGSLSGFIPVSVSPDGRRLAFAATDAGGKALLWVRPLDSLMAQPLSGTAGATIPFWSPDSRFLGFFADGKLKKVEASGGPVQTLADAPNRRGGTWNNDGVIVFTPDPFGGLARVSASGGGASPVTTLDSSRRETGHRFPQFLPDGRRFIYLVRSGQPENNGIYVGSLDSKETRRVLSTELRAAYGPPSDASAQEGTPGYLLFVREGTLLAQLFDANRPELTGEPFLIAEGVAFNSPAGASAFSMSETGTLVYVRAALVNQQLIWFDRGGRQLGTVGPPEQYGSTPKLSPDGKRIAVARGPAGREDIWLLELPGGATSRFTFDPSRDERPLWSPDGSRIIFRSGRRDGRYRLYQKSSSGAGSEELLFESSGNYYLNPQDWSSDGRFLLYMAPGEKTGFDLWVLPQSGERKPVPFLQTEANESQAQISPDGRWIAYTSDESKKDEVYVQSFPTPGSKRQISRDGGTQPRWRRDGKELFYIASDRKLMAVPVRGEATLEVGTPTVLFQTRLSFPVTRTPDVMHLYDVTADGQRFLLNLAAPTGDSGLPPITVVLNWTAGLKQ